jgi:hypothetical protein
MQSSGIVVLAVVSDLSKQATTRILHLICHYSLLSYRGDESLDISTIGKRLCIST